MTNHTSSLSEQSQAKDNSIGEALQSAREAASYSVAYVAAQTHLKEEVITALENDQFDQLPSDVFVKGYIRSYAKLLDLDSQTLLDAYPKDRTIEAQTVVTNVKRTKKLNSSGVDPVVIWSSVTVVAILMGLLMTWWVHQEDSNPVELASVVDQFDDQDVAEINMLQEPKQSEVQHNVVLGSVDPEHVSEQQNATPEVVDKDELVADTQAEVRVVPAIIEAPFSGGEIDKVRITVKYTQESWTEIFDARKRRLLHGLIKPGATRVISGQAPFNVFLGNSPGVELEINGKPFDHSVYMRRNNTARFLIDDNNS